MNRRRFIQSLAAVFTLPASPILSMQSATVALPAVAAVPKQARFWAIYMSALHGECTPKTLQNLLHIPEVDAKNYISQLIADEVIKPTPLLQRSVSNILKRNDESLLDKVKKRLEMKAQPEADEVEVVEAPDAAKCLDIEEATEFGDPETEPMVDHSEVDLEVVEEDEPEVAEPQQT